MTLINSFSFLFIISTKKSCVDIRIINGNISKSVEGTLSKVIINGRWNSEFEESLKKVISSNNVRININEKKIRVSNKIFFENNLMKYLSNVFIMISLLLIKIYKL